jgi:MFS family permease
VLLGGVGMVACGVITDRLSRVFPERKWVTAIAYSVISFVLLAVGFSLNAGPLQLALLGSGIFFVAGTSGPAGAMVANLTPSSMHAPAFATLTLANNLLGLAPGPIVTGMIADRIGLPGALRLVPFVALVATVALVIGKSTYGNALRRLDVQRAKAAAG